MSVSVPKRVILTAGWFVEGLGVAAVLFGSAFVCAIGTRAADALFGWNFHFESIGNFLGIHLAVGELGRKVLEWDRSFLLLGAALVTGYSATGIQSFIDWAQKSPEQREQARQRARQQAGAASEAAARNLKFQREQKAARKATKRPMSGWRRLWIVLSILFGVPTFLLAYDSSSSAYADIAWNGDNNAFWSAAYADPALRDCDWNTAKAANAGGAYAMVSCNTKYPLFPALLWALAPALLMAVVGLVVRWIYRGFRPPPRHEPEQLGG
jgi:hypothetical protein